MNLIKNEIEGGFTIAPNILIDNEKMTDRSRFLLIYLASKPNNWNFYNTQLTRALGYSEETLKKYMDELVKVGWITRITNNRKMGKFSNNIYIIHKEPFKSSETLEKQVCKITDRKKNDTENPVPINSDTEKNGFGKSPTHNNNNLKKEIKKIKNKESNFNKFLMD